MLRKKFTRRSVIKLLASLPVVSSLIPISSTAKPQITPSQNLAYLNARIRQINDECREYKWMGERCCNCDHGTVTDPEPEEFCNRCQQYDWVQEYRKDPSAFERQYLGEWRLPQK